MPIYYDFRDREGSAAVEPLNVLVIDDDDQLRMLLVNLVSRRGHQVVPAASAEEGLQLLPYFTFQVAYVDQRLPGMEGLVLGEYLRRNNPDMAIALVTGEDDRRLLRASREQAIHFIRKPFDIAEIDRVLDDYIAAAAEREQLRLRREDRDFAPPIARHAMDIAPAFDMPAVSRRVEERVEEIVRRCLNDLRSVGRYTERDRVVALAGLLAARVLGIDLPRLASGRTPSEEYDELMRGHGRRTEFEPS